MADNKKLIDINGLEVVYEDILTTLKDNYVKNSDVQESKTVTPKTSSQTIEADNGKSYLKQVVVAKIPNQRTKVTKNLSASTTGAQTVTIPSGYYTEDSTVTVNAISGGTHTGEVTTHTITNPEVTAVVGGSAFDKGVLETQNLSVGEEGKAFYKLTLTNGVTRAGSSVAKATAKIETAGYIDVDSSESEAFSEPISVTCKIEDSKGFTRDTFYIKGVKTVNVAARVVEDSEVPESNSETDLVIDAMELFDFYNSYNNGEQTNCCYELGPGYLRKSNIYFKKIDRAHFNKIDTNKVPSNPDLVSGKEAWANGTKVVGSMPNASYTKKDSSNNTEATGSAITPSTSAQVVEISAGYTSAKKITVKAIPDTYKKVSETTTTIAANSISANVAYTVNNSNVTASNKVIVLPSSASDAVIWGKYGLSVSTTQVAGKVELISPYKVAEALSIDIITIG